MAYACASCGDSSGDGKGTSTRRVRYSQAQCDSLTDHWNPLDPRRAARSSIISRLQPGYFGAPWEREGEKRTLCHRRIILITKSLPSLLPASWHTSSTSMCEESDIMAAAIADWLRSVCPVDGVTLTRLAPVSAIRRPMNDDGKRPMVVMVGSIAETIAVAIAHGILLYVNPHRQVH